MYGMKKKKKMNKGGKSFPDLNKDGKITQADILMGRGVKSKKKMDKGGKAVKDKEMFDLNKDGKVTKAEEKKVIDAITKRRQPRQEGLVPLPLPHDKAFDPDKPLPNPVGKPPKKGEILYKALKKGKKKMMGGGMAYGKKKMMDGGNVSKGGNERLYPYGKTNLLG